MQVECVRSKRARSSLVYAMTAHFAVAWKTAYLSSECGRGRAGAVELDIRDLLDLDLKNRNIEFCCWLSVYYVL